jgi:5'-nucleotidase
VDVIVSGHTHQAYVCKLDGRLVTSAGSYGRFVTDIDLTLDPSTRDVTAATAVNRPLVDEAPRAGAQVALIQRYTGLAEPLQRVVGRVASGFDRRLNNDGESTMGRVIADAHLAASAGAGAVVAFMNPGGIRAPFVERDNGEVMFSDLYGVYPFNNTLVTMTLSGAQLLELLEQQWLGTAPRVLQISSNSGYRWDARKPPGSRIVPGSVVIGGTPLNRDAAYRVTVNGFIAQGGDGFNVLTRGRDRVTGGSARDALAHYLQARAPVAVPQERRVRNIASEN